jgi:hypothetical protein
MLVLAFGAVRADKWMPPGEARYFSPDRRFRLTVLPRVLSSTEAYWSEHQADPRKRGQAPGERDTCIGQLERLLPDGTYTVVWRQDLVNDVAPVSALVSGDGRYVATFDDWHRMGSGKTAVVLYGEGGEPLASYALADFLTRKQIEKLPRSISSVRWGGNHHFDATGQYLVLEVLERGGRETWQPRPWLNATLALRSPREGFRVGPAQPRDAFHVISQARPQIVWEEKTRIRADMNCDRETDDAFLGRADGSVYVGVIASGVAMPEVLPFAVDAGKQAAICAEPAVLTAEPLDPPGPGGCAGLRLEGGDCDSIHLFWDRQSNRLSWSRN